MYFTVSQADVVVPGKLIGSHLLTSSSYTQELLVIDDLLFTMVGIEGKYIKMKRARPKDMSPSFSLDVSMDSSLQVDSVEFSCMFAEIVIFDEFSELVDKM